MDTSEKADPEEKLLKLAREFEDFAYIVSHDLKAPVRAINNLAEWIADDLEDCLADETRQNLVLLRNRADRLDKMITALVLYSRVNRTELDISQVPVRDMIRNIIRSNNHLGDNTYHIRVPDITLTTMGKKLHTVFYQLIDNAIKFGNKPEITITATDKQDFIAFCVADNGPGISAEAQAKVFSLFYTVASKDKGNTTGAGLAIVKKIVEFVGGEIWLISEPGKGASFCFTWPKTIQN